MRLLLLMNASYVEILTISEYCCMAVDTFGSVYTFFHWCTHSSVADPEYLHLTTSPASTLLHSPILLWKYVTS